MWFVWTSIGFVALSWIGLRWTKTLFTKYEHTAESIATLIILFILANYLSLRMTYVMIPVLNTWPRLILMVPLGLIVSVGFSFVAVHLWCSFLTKGFDDEIGALEEEKDDLQRQIDILRWQYVTRGIPLDSRGHTGEPFLEKTPELNSVEDLQEIVDNWQQAGGAARVRSIKTAEWKAEAEKWETDYLAKEIDSLASEAREEAVEAWAQQTKARIAILKMELRRRRGSEKPKTSKGVPVDRTSPENREIGLEEIRKRLQDIHGAIQLIESQKRDFLESKIRLTWRVHS